MPEPQHTFEQMLSFMAAPSQHLTHEANQELNLAYNLILQETWRRWHAFRDANQQITVEKQFHLFDQVSLFEQQMPRQPGEYGYHMMWGALFGMLIGQLNENLTTSGRSSARRAAIDYLRREAAKRGIVFA
ncbi:MAG: hypothetical protein WBB39_02860 [Candidatus Saccharimonadales bacterium]